MIRNFSIKSTVELYCEGDTYDLHNDYDCCNVSFSPITGGFVLAWSPIAASGATIQLQFERLKTLVLAGFDASMPRVEDRRLSFMGYLHPDDVSIMDGFLPESENMDDYHLIFAFEGGLVVKIFADGVKCIRKATTDLKTLK